MRTSLQRGLDLWNIPIYQSSVEAESVNIFRVEINRCLIYRVIEKKQESREETKIRSDMILLQGGVCSRDNFANSCSFSKK